MGNTKYTKEQIRERIQQKKILFDGAFGTYYGGKYDTRQLPELANLEAPERVKEIHREYLEAGAQILRIPLLLTASAWIYPGNRSERHCAVGFDWQGKQWQSGERPPERRKRST